MTRFLAAVVLVLPLRTNADPAALWRLAHRCEVQSEILWDVDFAPDGKRIVTACYDGSAQVWDAKTGAKLAVLRLPPSKRLERTSPASCVDWSPDGKRILAGGPPVAVFDAKTYKLLRVFPADEGVFFTDSGVVECGGNESSGYSGPYPISWWDAESGKEIPWQKAYPDWNFLDRLWENEVNLLGERLGVANYPPDQPMLVTYDPEPGTARLWDQQKRKLIRTLGKVHTGRSCRAATSSDGSRVVLWDGPRVHIFLADRDDPVARFEADAENMVLAEEGGVVAFWSAPPHTITLHDTASGQRVAELAHDAGELRAVDLAPDGTRMASVGMGKQLLIWERTAGNHE